MEINKKGHPSSMKGLKEVRKNAHLTQEDLSILMNVSLSTVRRWDKNIDNMPVSKVLMLSHILNVSVDKLVELVG